MGILSHSSASKTKSTTFALLLKQTSWHVFVNMRLVSFLTSALLFSLNSCGGGIFTHTTTTLVAVNSWVFHLIFIYLLLIIVVTVPLQWWSK